MTITFGAERVLLIEHKYIFRTFWHFERTKITEIATMFFLSNYVLNLVLDSLDSNKNIRFDYYEN